MILWLMPAYPDSSLLGLSREGCSFLFVIFGLFDYDFK